MIVKIVYKDQRLDIFDTSTFTASLPFSKQNLLTNFEVRFDLLKDCKLWLAAHYYVANDQCDKNSDGAKIGQRHKGYCFLLANKNELQEVLFVAVDGEIIIKRISGELVDVQTLRAVADEYIDTYGKGLGNIICTLYEHLKTLQNTDTPHIPGVSQKVIDNLQAAQMLNDEEDCQGYSGEYLDTDEEEIKEEIQDIPKLEDGKQGGKTVFI